MANVSDSESCDNPAENNELITTKNGNFTVCQQPINEAENAISEPKYRKLDDRNAGDMVKKTGLVLRPSALSRDSQSISTPSILKPPTLAAVTPIPNKFANCDEQVESLFNIPGVSNKAETAPAPAIPAVVPVAVPLSNPNYVFGQNIKDRVVESGVATNGNGGMLFTSAAINAESNRKDKADEKESSSLLEDAARCEQQRNTKRKYDEVQTTTGEENETNVLQTICVGRKLVHPDSTTQGGEMNLNHSDIATLRGTESIPISQLSMAMSRWNLLVVKLFAFEGGSWVERGRGSLRLNDSGGGASRIVVRTLGSLRVILNTKIWAGMQISRASDKSIRTTALDAAGVLKIFLIQATPSDINTLFTSMESRVRRCQENEKSTQEEESTTGDAKDNNAECPPSKVPALDLEST